MSYHSSFLSQMRHFLLPNKPYPVVGIVAHPSVPIAMFTYAVRTESIQSNCNVSSYPRCQVNFGFQIQLDTQQERSILGLSVIIDRPFDNGSGRAIQIRGRRRVADVGGNLTATRGLTVVRVRHIASGASGGFARTVSTYPINISTQLTVQTLRIFNYDRLMGEGKCIGVLAAFSLVFLLVGGTDCSRIRSTALDHQKKDEWVP